VFYTPSILCINIPFARNRTTTTGTNLLEFLESRDTKERERENSELGAFPFLGESFSFLLRIVDALLRLILRVVETQRNSIEPKASLLVEENRSSLPFCILDSQQSE